MSWNLPAARQNEAVSVSNDFAILYNTILRRIF
jgi:hypothetical protein